MQKTRGNFQVFAAASMHSPFKILGIVLQVDDETTFIQPPVRLGTEWKNEMYIRSVKILE